MEIKEALLKFIASSNCISAPVSENSNLYTDLLFDSLSFMRLLVEIEEAYSITFDITEMEACLHVGRLIQTIRRKIKEREIGDD